MKKGWQTRPLADVCEIKPPKAEARERAAADALVSFAPMEDLGIDRKFLNASQVKRLASVVGSYTYFADGDVLLAKITPCFENGKLGIAADLSNGIGFGSSEFIVLRPSASLDKEFLYYFLARPEFRTEGAARMGGAVGQQRVPKEFIESYRIPVPPLPEQQRMVGILDEVFEGIATAKANAEKNLRNARTLHDSGLNSAITGKLTQDWRRAHANTESASVHLRKMLAERRRQWRGTGTYKEPDSPVINKPLDIPDRWVLASPEQISTHIVDCPHSTPKWAKSGVLCLRTTNFKPGSLDLESVQFVSEESYNERIMRLEPKPGDVLYSREGGILGIACIIPKQLRTCMGQRMMLFRLDTNMALPEYFAGVLNSTLILSEVKRLTGGAASPHLNIRDIRTFPIPLPPITEQHQIVAKLNSISAETQRRASIYEQKLAALEALKKSLLHQAFTGQL